MAENVIELTDASFDEVVHQSDIPVLIDFWAPWCQPCLITSPWVEELAHDYQGRFKTAKMNVDENPTIPGRYGIRSIPTILLFKNGELVDTIVGAVGKANIEKAMVKLIQ